MEVPIMLQVNSKDMLTLLIKESELLLIFFTSNDFWGSEDLLCKVEKLLTHYPNVKSIKIDIKDNVALGAEHSVFIAPTILVFTYGKESLRNSKFILLNELESDINRYYNLIFST